MAQPKHLGSQGKPAPGAPTAAPKTSKAPGRDKPAPMNGSSFRGKKPGATGANDGKKAK